MENIKEEIIELIAENLHVEQSEVTEETSLEDLGADSLDIVELVMSTEEKFDIEIPDEDAQALKTVKDIIDFVQSKL